MGEQRKVPLLFTLLPSAIVSNLSKRTASQLDLGKPVASLTPRLVHSFHRLLSGAAGCLATSGGVADRRSPPTVGPALWAELLS